MICKLNIILISILRILFINILRKDLGDGMKEIRINPRNAILSDKRTRKEKMFDRKTNKNQNITQP